MVQSMTGFGSAEKNGYRVEIRSLNHRFLDVYFKSPGFLNQYEIDLRNAIKDRFSRGKFDVNIITSEQVDSDLAVNAEFARKIYAAFRKVQEDLSIPGQIDINMLTNFRDLIVESVPLSDETLLKEVFGEALERLSEMRIKEGEALASELFRMVEALRKMNARVTSLSGQIISDINIRFHERLKTLLNGQEVDENRILQESAVFAAKMDIAEEIARIESHLKQFATILTNGDIIGRKLDFILQELNREINTIGSKSADYGISSLVVDMKTEIEKMKEQVQNMQ